MQSTPFRVRHGIIVETSNNASTTIVANNQVLTGSASNALVDLATTWNTTGNPTALKLNVTNTASGASSALMDLQVGGSSRFYVSANGNIGIGTSTPSSSLTIGNAKNIALLSNTTADGKISFVGGNGNEHASISREVNAGLSLYSYNDFVFSSGVSSVNFVTYSKPSVWKTYGGGSFNFVGYSGFGGEVIMSNLQNAEEVFHAYLTSPYKIVMPKGDFSIGLTSPTAKFTVANGTSATSAHIYGTYTDGSNYERINLTANSTASYIQSQQAGTGTARSLFLGANNATHMAVAANGNVGVGTTAPAYPLQVRRAGGAGSLGITVDNVFSGLDRTIKYLSVGDSGTDTSGHAFYSRNGSTTDIGALYITPSGNVSIGTTSASAKLHVLGTSLFRSTGAAITLDSASATDARMEFLYNGTRSGYISVDNSTFSLTANSAAALILGANAQEHMRVAANGNIGIGNTAPGHKLSIDGSIYMTPSDSNRIWSGTDNLRLGNYPQLVVSDTLHISGGQQSITFGGTGAYATIGSTVPWDFARGVTAQGIRIYGTYTDVSNYERLNVNANSSGHFIQSQQAGTGTARSLFLGANNAVRTTISPAGSVGIGTTTPDANSRIEISGPATTNTTAIKITSVSGDNGSIRKGIDISTLGAPNSTYYGLYVSVTSHSGNWAIYAPNGQSYFGSNVEFAQTVSLRGTTDSNIGTLRIGDRTSFTGPGNGGRITFWGDERSQGSDFAAFAGIKGIKENGLYLNSLGALVFETQSVSSFGVGTDLTEKMRISSNGNVGIGNNAPIYKLRVEGDISSSGNVIVNNTLSTTNINASGNVVSTGTVITNDFVLSNTNVAALHRSPNAITALNIYDTSKDSDGGAWTEKCQGASWYNEPLAGKWLGPQFNEAFARNSGAAVGSELITNGTFNNGVSGWTAGTYGTSTISASNNVLRVAETGAHQNPSVGQTVSVTSGKTYKVTFDVVFNTSSAGIGCWVGSAYGTANWLYSNVTYGYSFPGRSTFYFTAAGATAYFELIGYMTLGGTSEYFEVANISVREVTALTTASNDYYQLTTDGKFYRLYKNLLLNTGTLTAAAGWTVSNATSVVGATDPNAGTSAYTFTATANNGYILRASNKAISGLQHTNSIYVRRVSGSGAVTLYNDLGSEVAITLTTSWARYSTTWTATGSNGYCGIKLAVSGDIVEIWNPQEEFGNVATTYEAKVAEGAAVEIFRGNKADFPRLAAIVAEANTGIGRVTIYDLTEPGCPMWMAFTNGPSAADAFFMIQGGSTPVVSMKNAVLAVGNKQNTLSFYGHLRTADFVSDKMRVYVGTYNIIATSRVGISRRNTAEVGFGQASSSGDIEPAVIVSGAINAVAMTVLPDAPLNPFSGLPIPTIAVATDHGVFVIKHNGSVVNIVNGDGANYATYVGFTRENRIITQLYDDNRGLRVFDIPNTDVTQANHYTKGSALEWYADFWGSYPTSGGGSNQDLVMNGVNTGPTSAAQLVSLMGNKFVRAQQGYSDTINIVSRNRSTPTKSLLATLSPKHSTGWMVGDIRTALLSSSLTTSISGTAVLNAQVANLSLSPWSGAVTKSGSTFTYTAQYQEFVIVWQNVPNGTVNGLSWRVNFSIKRLSGSGAFVVSTQRTTINNPGKTYTPAIGETITDELVITTSLTESLVGWAAINFLNGSNAGAGSFEIISVTVSPADGDVSYNGNGAAVFGTITRSQVATNASIVGYSGFSTSNYLRQPYNSKLDFVTSEWNASAWVNIPVILPLANFPAIGSNVIVNGTFAADTNWTKGTGWTISGGVATHTGAPIGNLQQSILTAGVAYRITMNVSGGVVNIYAGGGSYLFNMTGAIDVILVATDPEVYIQCSVDGVTVDNVSYVPVGPAMIAERAHSSGTRIRLGIHGNGFLTADAFDGATTRTVTTTGAYNIAQWMKAEANYTTDGSLSIRVNGREVAVTRGNPLLTLNNASAVLTIGNNYAANGPFPGSIALLKLGATVPTYEQSQFMYDQEKQLFRANALSVLPDTGAIVDMAYDDATDRWAAVSATNESYWSGLIRNSVTASPAGSYTKISTTSGVELASRSTTNPGVDVTIPSYGLREELVKRSESAARLTKELVVLDYVGGFTASTTNGSTAITSVNLLTYPTSYIGAVISGSGIPANTTIVAVSGTTIYLSAAATATAAGVTISFLDFKLPVGMETKTVMVAGAVKQEGSTKDYTRLYDGFIETIRFGAAPGTAAWVQIQAAKGSV